MLARHLQRPRLAIAKPPRWTISRRRIHDLQGFATEEAASTAIHEVSGLFASIHAATGLPWLLTIPLVALGFRSIIYLTLSKPARVNRQRMADVRNIIHTMTMARITKAGNTRRSPKDIKETVAVAQRQCYKNWGIDPKKRWYPLLQLPMFLFIMEDIRKVTGAPTGLLGAIKQRIVGLFGGSVDVPATANTEVVGTTNTTSTAEVAPHDSTIPDQGASFPSAPQSIEFPGSTALDGGSTVAAHADSVVRLDPSLLNGGPFWCPDLTALDPTMFLPLAIPTIMCINAVYSGKDQLTSTGMRGAFSRALVLLPMAMLFVTVKLPAGMLLYWFCSATIGLAIQVWAEIKHPIHEMGGKGFKPLKRVFRGSIQTVKVKE